MGGINYSNVHFSTTVSGSCRPQVVEMRDAASNFGDVALPGRFQVADASAQCWPPARVRSRGFLRGTGRCAAPARDRRRPGVPVRCPERIRIRAPTHGRYAAHGCGQRDRVRCRARSATAPVRRTPRPSRDRTGPCAGGALRARRPRRQWRREVAAGAVAADEALGDTCAKPRITVQPRALSRRLSGKQFETSNVGLWPGPSNSACPLFILPLVAMRHRPDLRPSPLMKRWAIDVKQRKGNYAV